MNKIDHTIYDNLELLPEDISGWNGNSAFFTRLIDQVRPHLIIEVGTWKGQSAINMARHIKKSNYKAKIFCVDTWLGALEFWDSMANTPERNLRLKNGYPQVYYQFLSNVVHAGVKDIISPFPTTSDIAYRYFANRSISPELIYIDASHDEDDVYRDICNYFKILKNGGVIFGDDYVAWEGVRKAVNNFTATNLLKLEIVENNFWVLHK